MKNINKAIPIIFFILICSVIFLAGCSENLNNEPDSGSSIVDIYIPGYEKADVIIITTENNTIMIDTGLGKMVNNIVDYLVSHDCVKIDYLIITHFDNDHIGTADRIIGKFPIGEVIVPNYEKDSKLYNLFIESVKEMELTQIILTDTMEFTLDGVEFTLYPSEREYRDYNDENNESSDESDENNYSIAVTMIHGNNKFFFAGDAMAERIDELLELDEIKNTEYDFLKVPHHGKYNKRIKKFISAINPHYAVITCSSDKPADDKVISALNKAKAEIFLTSDGNIYCQSDGDNIAVSILP